MQEFLAFFCNFKVAEEKHTEKRFGLLQKWKIKLVLLITQRYDTKTNTPTHRKIK